MNVSPHDLEVVSQGLPELARVVDEDVDVTRRALNREVIDVLRQIVAGETIETSEPETMHDLASKQARGH